MYDDHNATKSCSSNLRTRAARSGNFDPSVGSKEESDVRRCDSPELCDLRILSKRERLQLSRHTIFAVAQRTFQRHRSTRKHGSSPPRACVPRSMARQAKWQSFAGRTL